MLTLISWLDSVCQISPLGDFSPFFHTVFVERKSLNFKSGGICITSWKAQYLHKLFDILLRGRFVSSSQFIYSVIYSYQCELRDISFVLWAIIQYYYIYFIKLFQLWPLEAPLDNSCVFLIHMPLPPSM